MRSLPKPACALRSLPMSRTRSPASCRAEMGSGRAAPRLGLAAGGGMPRGANHILEPVK